MIQWFDYLKQVPISNEIYQIQISGWDERFSFASRRHCCFGSNRLPSTGASDRMRSRSALRKMKRNFGKVTGRFTFLFHLDARSAQRK